MLRNFVLAKKARFYLLANNFLYNMETLFFHKSTYGCFTFPYVS